MYSAAGWVSTDANSRVRGLSGVGADEDFRGEDGELDLEFGDAGKHDHTLLRSQSQKRVRNKILKAHKGPNRHGHGHHDLAHAPTLGRDNSSRSRGSSGGGGIKDHRRTASSASTAEVVEENF